MLLSELLQKLQIKTTQNVADISVSNMAIHSEKILPQTVFVAIKGTGANGADFAARAVEKGAVAVLSEEPLPSVTQVPVIVVENARLVAAQAASLIYSSPLLQKVAVTGTNGKTSTVFFVRQLLKQIGISAASIGTIGVESDVFIQEGHATMPDPVQLNKTLNLLQSRGIRVAALEASSHGLEQGRSAGFLFEAGAFTNLTRDHLDYHGTMENYLSAKAKLFSQYIRPGGTAVLNADIPEFEKLKDICVRRNLHVLSYGWNGQDLKILEQEACAGGQRVSLKIREKQYQGLIPVSGEFQLMNILAAVGLCLGVGAPLEKLLDGLSSLQAPRGRMECVGRLENGAEIYVDYAHTPDALQRVLTSLRAHTSGRLFCVFGCGGNRDVGKRAQMGALADQLADVVYVTDDNPRFEDPKKIRQMILEACPRGVNVSDRSTAIRQAVSQLQKGDVLVIAGKGHENDQIVAGKSYVFDDKIEAKLALMSREKNSLWTGQEISLALNVPIDPDLKAFRVILDTRQLSVGDLFIALKGDHFDGFSYIPEAVQKGAAVCITSRLHPDVLPSKQIVVPDTEQALEALGRFARMRSAAHFVGVTGSSGKTTTKEMLRIVLSDQGKTQATSGNFNNTIGVPLTLANLSRDVQYAVIEMGMNHFGELSFLSDLVRPDVTVVTMIGSAHRAFFKSEKEIAQAKSEIFDFQSQNGVAVLNKDDAFFEELSSAASQKGIHRHITFGSRPQADFVLQETQLTSEGMTVFASWHGSSLKYTLAFKGKHFALNSLAVLGVVDALGGSVDQAVLSLEKTKPVSGRGAVQEITLAQGGSFCLIDDAYNANPSSVKASLETLGLYEKNRKIAVLGDMLELGDESEKFHLSLKKNLQENKIDKVYLIGHFMEILHKELPEEIRGGFFEKTESLFDRLKADIRPGDVVLIKASNGMKLAKVIDGLKGK